MMPTSDQLDIAVRSLADSLTVQRWFAQKDRAIRDVARLDESLDGEGDLAIALTLCEVSFVSGPAERYFCPFVFSSRQLDSDRPPLAVESKSDEAVWIYDGLTTSHFGEWLRTRMLAEVTLPSTHGSFQMKCLVPGALQGAGPAQTVQLEQSNSSMLFGDELIAKIYRRFAIGQNPEIEIGEALSEIGASDVAPRPIGWMSYTGDFGTGATAMVQELIPTSGDLWAEITQHLASPERVLPAIGGSVGLLTADLHRALLDQRLTGEMRSQEITLEDATRWSDETRGRIAILAEQLPDVRTSVDHSTRDMIDAFLAARRDLYHRVEGFGLLTGLQKTRVHGDFHLGQVLRKRDGAIVAIDFEGEPAKSIAERRTHYSPLKDLAGVLRSISYARGFTQLNASGIRPASQLAEWENSERETLIAAYLDRLDDVRDQILPAASGDADTTIRVWELDKALYEAQYELANRPDWLAIPLRSIVKLV